MAVSAQPSPVRIHHDATSAGDVPDGPAARRATGLVAIVTALLGCAGFAVLSVVFEFPDVLNRPAAEVLPLFAAEERAVDSSYLALAMTGIGFAVLAVGVGRIAAGPRTAFLPAITAVGVLAGLAQTIGFIRWPFLVPVLSDAWADPASSEATRASVATTYDALNAYAGGALGEHLGWVLQAAWGIGAAVALERSGLVGVAWPVPGSSSPPPSAR
jgi:hypothetical protein